MDLGSISSSGGAVACPVCTLYLREGISLQRHLDTHPKEQVIEALIKASSAPSAPVVTQSPLPPMPMATPAHHQVNANPQIPAQSPSYPVGSVYECPSPIMPPQFASFSYQQFVNNGTMMIPQYAMAPQANQMMQMLYNPYNMYQQQQIPTVQMISPIATIPTRIRPVVNVGGEAGQRSIIIPSGSTESKQEQLLTEVPTTPTPGDEEVTPGDDAEATARLQVEDRGQQTRREYQNQEESCDATPGEEAVARREYQNQESCETVNDEDKRDELPQEVEEECKVQEFNREMDVEETSEKLGTSAVTKESDDVTVEDKEQQPEVEQLERLLITIVDSDEEKINEIAEKKEEPEVTTEDLEYEVVIVEAKEDADDTSTTPDVLRDESAQSATSSAGSSTTCKIISDVVATVDVVVASNFNNPYRYRCSVSAPASPVAPAKHYRTYSIKSEYGSNENVNFYPITLHDEDETKHQADNFDEEDMEIDDEDMDDIESSHTPFVKEERSGTPLSEISGISGMRAKTKSKDSIREFCRVQTDNSSEEDDEDDEEDEDDDEEEDDEDEDDNESNCSADCSIVGQIAETSCNDENAKTSEPDACDPIEISERKSECNQMYHQSVITEHVSSFPSVNTHGQQQTLSLHDNYSISSNNKSGHNSMLNIAELVDPTTSTETKSFQAAKTANHHHHHHHHQPNAELLNINEDAHVFEFDGLQILVPSAFMSESSQKAISATSQQSMASSEGGVGNDEEVKSVNMRADETMPPRGELSEQESNGCTEPSAWQVKSSS